MAASPMFHSARLINPPFPSRNSSSSSPPRFRPMAYYSDSHHDFRGVASSSANPYLTLGLSQGASERDIKTAYRKLALQFHPDVCKEDSCTAKFTQISDAYQSIMDCLRGDGGMCVVMEDESRPEPMMGVDDDSWEEWEEWMGWEGAGTRDYSNHISSSFY